MEQILGKNCNQIFSGAPYRVKKDQGHLITSVFGIRGTVPGTKSSGALWILLHHPNSGHGRETQNIGCTQCFHYKGNLTVLARVPLILV